MLRSGMDWQQRSGGEGRAAEGSGLAVTGWEWQEWFYFLTTGSLL